MSHLETFEARTLLSHGDTGYTPVSIEVIDGTLTIRGTAGKDYVTVTEAAKVKKSAKRVISDDFVVLVGNDHPTKFTFPKSQVTAVDVDMGDGDDRFSFSAQRRYTKVKGKLVNPLHAVPVSINGGDGKDNLAGAGNAESINGGLGDDYISAGAGDDSVEGGEGNDFIDGGYGDDLLRGGNGADRIYTGPGADDVHGDAGDDTLCRDGLPGKNAGVATINGGAGNDTYRSFRRFDNSFISVESAAEVRSGSLEESTDVTVLSTKRRK